MACSIITNRSFISNGNDITKKAISTSCPFKTGVFRLNGATIRVETGDSLKTIASKINAKKNITGIHAKVIGGKLELYSKKQIVEIVDYDSVLKKFYEKKELGCNDNCLIQITRIGSNSNYIIIKYKTGADFHSNYSNIVLSGYNGLVLAEIGYADMVAKHKIASEEERERNEFHPSHDHEAAASQENKLGDDSKESSNETNKNRDFDFAASSMIERLEHKANLSKLATLSPLSLSSIPKSSRDNFNFKSARMKERLLHRAKLSIPIQTAAPLPSVHVSGNEDFNFESATMKERLLHRAKLPKLERIQPKALIKHRSTEDTFNFAAATMKDRLLQKCQ